MPPAAVEIRGLVKKYRQFTLGPLDLTVPVGAIYGLVGPNGAGKTTALDLIFGVGAKDAGSIAVLGHDHLRDELAVRRVAACVSPELNYQPWGHVGGAIRFVRGFYPTWDESYCDRLLAEFRVRRDEKIGALSLGARIKLTLVLALSWRPSVLVLDEPTVGLDAISRQQMFGELLDAVRDESRTILISSHGIADLERFADHVGMLKDGRLLFEGAIAEVVGRYRLLDVAAARGLDLDAEPGVTVQHRDGNRWRLLLDREATSVDRLLARGAHPIAEAPVSLEELFVALGRS